METGSVLTRKLPQRCPLPSTSIMRLPTIPTPWLLLPAFTGILLWLCYYPLGWGFLAWAALVPLLFLVRMDARPWQIYLGAYVGGCILFGTVLLWMPVADYRMWYTWGMLATYCALYFPAGVFLIRGLDRATRLPLAITVPVAWTALEFVRSFLLTGFSWYYLGHTQHDYLAVIQIADLAGAYAVSFVLAAVNGCVVELLIALPEVRSVCRQVKEPRIAIRGFEAVVVVLVAATLIYGSFRLSQEDFRPGPRVALLQSNLDQRLRNEVSGNSAQAVPVAQQMLKRYWDLCRLAAAQFPAPDLVVWPETSFPYTRLELPQDLRKIPDDKKEEARLVSGLLREMAKETKANQLFGLNTRVFDEEGQKRQYNSALLVSATGNALGRYDKIHRVPFGEYVPFRDWFPFMDRFAPYDFDYGIRVGEKRTRFELGHYRFGVIICFEDTDPFLARQYARAHADGPSVDFLVNISNDGWFDGSSEHAEHLAISRFRAIEARRPLVRAVNMGISAVIDSNGRVQKPTPFEAPGDAKMWAVVEEKDRVPDLTRSDWKDFTKVEGVLMATIPLDHRESFYAYTGDWLPSGCWLLLAGVWVRRRVKWNNS